MTNPVPHTITHFANRQAEKVAQTKRQAQRRQVELAQTAQDTAEALRKAQLELRHPTLLSPASSDRPLRELKGRLEESEHERIRLEERLRTKEDSCHRKRAWREENDTMDMGALCVKSMAGDDAADWKGAGGHHMPAVFVNHGGGPMPILGKQPGIAKFFQSYPATLPTTPSAILIVTAHWETERQLKVSGAKSHKLYFDYGGFPKESYEYEYPAPGSPGLANRSEKISQEERKRRLSSWLEAPSALEAQPRGQAEHLMPLFVVLGAAGYAPGRLLNADADQAPQSFYVSEFEFP
eukprot:g8113.t1